ncbi:MAG: hypothetical protein KAJ49_00490 [Arcobacteraceae bacterium]|nr:hypothetical protein [Arcobacteraceae bacterium]
MENEEIEKIVVKSLKGQRKTSTIINNFYSLITIVIMSIVIIWYVNYILPFQKENKQKHLKKEQYKEYIQIQKEKREAQIELSKKLHKEKK